jgi:hypothetical protein
MNDGSLYAWGTNQASPSRVPNPNGAFYFKVVEATENYVVALDQSGASWYSFSPGQFTYYGGAFIDVKTSPSTGRSAANKRGSGIRLFIGTKRFSGD